MADLSHPPVEFATLSWLDEIEGHRPQRVDGVAAGEDRPFAAPRCGSSDGVGKRHPVAQRVHDVAEILGAGCSQCGSGRNQVVSREGHFLDAWAMARGEDLVDDLLRQARRGHVSAVLRREPASVSSVAGGGCGPWPSQHEYFLAELLACCGGVTGAEQVD